MSSTPKQQDGNGSVSAGASLSPLEQTLLGVAPPPPSAPVSPRPPALPLEAPAVPSLPSPSIAVAPVIAVSSAATAPAVHSSGAEPARAEHLPQDEQTALSADDQQTAPVAALARVEERASPAPEPLVHAGSGEAPPARAARDITADLSSTDTHRSIVPAFEDGAEPARRAGSPVAGRGFEPVPVMRAPLAESLSSALGPLAELGGSRFPLPPPSRPRTAPAREREGVGRWLLLAAVALATVGIVSVGGRLWHRYRAQGAQHRLVAGAASVATPAPPSASDPASASRGPATHALLANRPAPAAGPYERVHVVSATAEAPSADVAGASASPESQLAATAGRHVLSGNYAEALPLYRQLERSWPENTSYAAMAKLLEKKVGSRNDTRTVTPAPSSTP